MLPLGTGVSWKTTCLWNHYVAILGECLSPNFFQQPLLFVLSFSKVTRCFHAFLWLWKYGSFENPLVNHNFPYKQMAVCQNLVPLVNIKIAGKWMFIPLKMVLIGIDPNGHLEGIAHRHQGPGLNPPNPWAFRTFVNLPLGASQKNHFSVENRRLMIKNLDKPLW